MRPVLSVDVAVRDDAAVYRLGLSVARDVFMAPRSDLVLDKVGRAKVGALRSGLSTGFWFVELRDILFGFAVMPDSLRPDSFSVVSALLSTEGCFVCAIDVEVD